MAINPNNADQLLRLSRAVTHSRQRLSNAREQRRKFVQQYVGSLYGADEPESPKETLNMIELQVSILSRSIIANTPQSLITTDQVQLKPDALSLELLVNMLMREINLGETLTEIAVDAMFGMGIAKVGLELDASGIVNDVGEPFVESVSLDDWVHDVQDTKRRREARFLGNRYTLPMDIVMSSDEYDRRAKQMIAENQSKSHINEGGDEELVTVQEGSRNEGDILEDTVRLWDIWLPQEQLLVTIPAGSHGEESFSGTRPLRVMEWDGPEFGPYHLLGFKHVPDNFLPLAPVMTMAPLHEGINMIYNKLMQQAKEQKQVLTFQGDASSDAERLNNARDGEAVSVDNPDLIKEIQMRSISQENFAFVLNARQMFDLFSGNLSTLGGLTSQAETLGQEELLERSASKMVAAMQDAMVTFTTKVMRDLAWYVWTDDLLEADVTKRIPGTDLRVTETFVGGRNETEFFDFNFDIEPYSLQAQSPAQRLANLTQFLNVMIQLAPQLAEQGIQINFEGIARTWARYTNMNELEDVLTFGGPPQQQFHPSQRGQQAQAGQKDGRTTRVNIPAASFNGQEQVMSQLALGGRPQDDQLSSLFRNTA